MKPHPGRLKTRGEKNAAAKLTESQVKLIRHLAPYVQHKRLAELSGVSETQIYRIVRKIDWKHIKDY